MKEPTDKKNFEKSPNTAAKRDEQSKPGKGDDSKAGKATTLDEQGEETKDGGPKTGFAAVVPRR